MRHRRASGLALSILTILIIILEASPTVPVGRAVEQSVQTARPWTDALSGGVWAQLHHLQSNTTALDSAQAQAILSSLASNPIPSQDPPYLFTNNYRVTTNSSLFPLEDEPSIAVRNQTGQFLMVVGANSLSTGHMVSYTSTDQATTWSSPTYLPLARGNDTFASDPALGVDRAGTFYYSFLSIATNSAGNITSDSLVVATSTDGVHWTNHIAIPPKLSDFYDKDYLSIGPNKNNLSQDTIYITTTDFSETCPTPFTCNENSRIMQAHSTDSGTTWSTPVQASPTATSPRTATNGHLITGSMPAVAPNGDLYIAYFDTGPNGFLNTTASIMIRKSTDGGLSFSTPTQAAPIPQQLTYASQGSTCCFRWWSSMFPSMDIAPDGTVYISYGARQSMFSTDPADVYLVASTDGGTTWNTPTKINDNTNQRGSFFAWLKVSTDNVVHIIWGDQRLDPVGLGYDIFYATATNHGTSITPNIRVTDTGTDPLFTIRFVGDYFNLAVSGNQVYPVWTDGRRGVRPVGREILMGETDIYTARLGPQDTPSISILGTGTAGYQGPVTVTGTGLPREAYFVMRDNNIPVSSQTHLISFFFSTYTGTLSDVIIPGTNIQGAYTVQLDEWLSGTPLATTTLYMIDTRPLQVSINGPSTASPGDNITWTIQLSPPTGPASPGYSTTYTINQALLTTPTGTVQDLTGSIKHTGPATYTLSTKLPTNNPAGTYTLYINASQTGQLSRNNGIGTTSVSTNSQIANVANLASTDQTLTIIVGIIAAIGVALQLFQIAKRKTGTPNTSTPTSPPSPPANSPQIPPPQT